MTRPCAPHRHSDPHTTPITAANGAATQEATR